MGIAVRASDLRRWKTFQGQSGQLDLMEQLRQEIDSRPQPLYQLDQWMRTPIGLKRVSDSYYSQTTGWQYRFWTRSFTYTFKESEISPYEVSQGEKLLIADCMKFVAGSG
jgi:hypothetical protein